MCSVKVEAAGRILKPKTKAQVFVDKEAAQVRVLGFPRAFTFGREKLKVHGAHVDSGKLSVVLADGVIIMLSNAQVVQLKQLLLMLQPPPFAAKTCFSFAPTAVASPAKAPRLEATQVQAVKPHLQFMPQVVMDIVQEFYGCLSSSRRASALLLQLACVCREFDARLLQTQHSFSCPQPMEPKLYRVRIQRQGQNLRSLNLAGMAFTGESATDLAQALGASSPHLRSLVLRGCKALSDAMIRRFIQNCPELELLDLLNVPRLSNRAVLPPPPGLKVLAIGSFHKYKPSSECKHQQGTLFVGDSVATLRPGKTALQSNVSSSLVKELSNVGMTHLILANCEDINVLHRPPQSLQLLDLQGSLLQMPERAAASWRPLSTLPVLRVLVLSGCQLLGPAALKALVASVPAPGLKVLNLSETLAGPDLFNELPALHPRLTHLAAVACQGLRSEGLSSLLAAVEVLNITDCRAADPLVIPLVPPKLRLLGLGRSSLALGSAYDLNAIRRMLLLWAPAAEVVVYNFDLLNSYSKLPPELC